MKVYISGPVTSLPYKEAKKNFSIAQQKLEKKGYEVVNPLNIGLPLCDTWTNFMKADIKMLMDCDAIYMLAGWQGSQGAVIELNLAIQLGYKIIN